MITSPAPRYRFDPDARYVLTVRDPSGRAGEHRVEGYQGWLTGPDGVRHRFGAARRTRTEVPDAQIVAVLGPLGGPGAAPVS